MACKRVTKEFELKILIRISTFIFAAGVLLSHGLTEGTSMWSNHLVKNIEIISGPDPFVQFQLTDVPSTQYFRFYTSQNKIFTSLLASLLSAKSTATPITVMTSTVSSSGMIHSLTDAGGDSEILFP
jgi:hypothetical protein